MAPDRDPDAKNISWCALCKLKEQPWRLWLAILLNPESFQCLVVQGCQVSGPAHLDLRVNPNGVLVWEPARPTVEQVEEEIWLSRAVMLNSQNS